MTFGWGSDTPGYADVELDTLSARFNAAELKTDYYTPKVHGSLRPTALHRSVNGESAGLTDYIANNIGANRRVGPIRC